MEIISRDRGGDYASAATQATPQAVQVADRFHVYKNLSETVELALTRCRAEIRKKAEAAVSDQVIYINLRTVELRDQRDFRRFYAHPLKNRLLKPTMSLVNVPGFPKEKR